MILERLFLWFVLREIWLSIIGNSSLLALYHIVVKYVFETKD